MCDPAICTCVNTPLSPINLTFPMPTCVRQIGTPILNVGCANVTCTPGSCGQNVTFEVCPGDASSEVTCAITVYTLTFTGFKEFILQVPVFDQVGCDLPEYMTFLFDVNIGTQTCYYCSPQTCSGDYCTVLSINNLSITFDPAAHTLTVTGQPVFNCPASD
ncbi:hypothetical protein [Fictibacillus fluitans]|uniref:Uncharacterized protein n=1 Tax=Fictibacillus fluitans TaxID=3058422 RepID=A0ABT8HWE7_9BACL|nr:hypothetical protein [Fictibacillus sp. NE201]MDN4525102.1 hypothetical protein [Fictibacillus sp. NE201]